MAETIEINIPLHLQTQQATQEFNRLRENLAQKDVNFKPVLNSVDYQPKDRTEAERQTLIQMFGNNSEVQKALTDSSLSAADKIKKAGDISERLAKELEKLTRNLRLYDDAIQDSENSKIDSESLQTQSQIQNKKQDETADMLRRMFNVNLLRSAFGIGDTISGGHLAYTQQLAQGNIVGADLSKNDTINNAIKGIGGIVTMLNPAIGAVVYGIGAIGDWINNVNKEHKAYADVYESKLPTLSRVGATFGGDNINLKSASTNQNEEFSRWKTLLSYAKDTGMNDEQFMSLATSLSRYGINDVNSAGRLAQNAAKFSRYTNGDESQANLYANFLGTQARYGSLNPENDLKMAFLASRKSGLDKNQFPEFLQGLQRVIEDGISKGYVKSTKDVATTMAFFSKLSSGSDFWKGQQGFQRLQSINSGLSNITNLSSTSDLIAYQAINGMSNEEKRKMLQSDTNSKNWTYLDPTKYGRDGDILNNFMIAEQGINNKNFAEISERLNNVYGEGNYLEKVMAIRQMSGLNYTGSVQLLEMMQKATDPKNLENFDFEAAIKDMKDKGYNDAQTVKTNYDNELKKYLTELGKGYWNDFLKIIQGELQSIKNKIPGQTRETTETRAERELSQTSVANQTTIMDGGNENIRHARERMNTYLTSIDSLTPDERSRLKENGIDPYLLKTILTGYNPETGEVHENLMNSEVVRILNSYTQEQASNKGFVKREGQSNYDFVKRFGTSLKRLNQVTTNERNAVVSENGVDISLINGFNSNPNLYEGWNRIQESVVKMLDAGYSSGKFGNIPEAAFNSMKENFFKPENRTKATEWYQNAVHTGGENTGFISNDEFNEFKSIFMNQTAMIELNSNIQNLNNTLNNLINAPIQQEMTFSLS